MITIVNKGGLGEDTKVFDENGKDLTTDLSIRSIVINIEPDDSITATLDCYLLDMNFTSCDETVIFRCPYKQDSECTKIKGRCFGIKECPFIEE